MSAAYPPAPALPQRGYRGSKTRRPMLLAVFVGVLAAVIVGALLVVNSSAPAEPAPECPGGPCGNPPKRPEQPEVPKAGALIQGKIFESPALGYRFEFNQLGGQFRWKVTEKTDTSVVLELNGGIALLVLDGAATSDLGPNLDAAEKAAFDQAVSNAGDRIPDLKVNDDPTEAVLEPSVGYRRGVGELFGGTFQTPQGAGFPVVGMISAAADDEATVAATILTSQDNRDLVFSLVDSLMNTFRFPSELTGQEA